MMTRVGLLLAALLAFVALPFVATNYVLYLLNLMAINLILAVGLDILTGWTGQISLGHAGFAAIGQVKASARLAGLHAGTWYDSALVIMGVSVDLAGRPAPPTMPPEMQAWDEDWLFQRSARPGGDPMIRPPTCPACGAPTAVDEAGRCSHCRVPVPVLTTGWLATRIVSHHPGYALMRARMAEDLGANPDVLANMSPVMRKLLPPGVADGVTGPYGPAR